MIENTEDLKTLFVETVTEMERRAKLGFRTEEDLRTFWLLDGMQSELSARLKMQGVKIAPLLPSSRLNRNVNKKS